jgi:hypothetical protein
MPRVSKIEMCMFCESVPCECNKPAPKARAPRKPKESVATAAPAPVAAFDPAPIRRPGPFAGFRHPTEQLAEIGTEAHATVEALEEAYAAPAAKRELTETEKHARALMVIVESGILAPDEAKRIRNEIVSARDPQLDARVSAWKKARRG